jgi:hypothetical protein
MSKGQKYEISIEQDQETGWWDVWVTNHWTGRVISHRQTRVEAEARALAIRIKNRYGGWIIQRTSLEQVLGYVY